MPEYTGQFQRVELGFGADSFHQPTGYSGIDAWVRQIVQLCTMEKGTIASNPTLGIGIKRYDFLLEEDRHRLEAEINRQVPIFYPDMPFLSCTVLPSDPKEDLDMLRLVIYLSVNGEVKVVGVALKREYNYIDFKIMM